MWRTHGTRLLAALALLTVVANGGDRNTGGYQLSGPYTHNNLTLFLIHDSCAVAEAEMQTLAEAIDAKTVVVYEKGEVDELEVENVSNVPVFIQAGNIVVGGQQDRVLRYDFVVKPHSGKQSLESFCVEQRRWSKRGKESDTTFDKVTTVDACGEIKKKVQINGSQAEVWQEVDDLLTTVDDIASIRGGRAGETSQHILTSTMENKQLKTKLTRYIDSLTRPIEPHTDAIGMVVVINGQITGADIYHSQSLFAKLQARLLATAALDAVTAYDSTAAYVAMSVDDVRQWLADANIGEISSITIGECMYVTKIQTDKTVSIESTDDTMIDGWIHKSILLR